MLSLMMEKVTGIFITRSFAGRSNGNPYSNALMMGQVRSIRWTQDGWPVIMPERYGDVPQLTILESELKGTWENITLEYNLVSSAVLRA